MADTKNEIPSMPIETIRTVLGKWADNLFLYRDGKWDEEIQTQKVIVAEKDQLIAELTQDLEERTNFFAKLYKDRRAWVEENRELRDLITRVIEHLNHPTRQFFRTHTEAYAIELATIINSAAKDDPETTGEKSDHPDPYTKIEEMGKENQQLRALIVEVLDDLGPLNVGEDAYTIYCRLRDSYRRIINSTTKDAETTGDGPLAGKLDSQLKEQHAIYCLNQNTIAAQKSTIEYLEQRIAENAKQYVTLLGTKYKEIERLRTVAAQTLSEQRDNYEEQLVEAREKIKAFQEEEIRLRGLLAEREQKEEPKPFDPRGKIAQRDGLIARFRGESDRSDEKGLLIFELQRKEGDSDSFYLDYRGPNGRARTNGSLHDKDVINVP